MIDIHDVTAEPHFSEPLESCIPPARLETLFALLAHAFEGDTGIDVKLHEGEIFISMRAS
jgi:hypothetical protein